MFESDDKKKQMKESLLEDLIQKMLSLPDEGSDAEEKSESPEEEALEDKLGSDGKPKMEMQIMKVEAKPKEKFKLSDGTEMEDESLEDILKRKKSEKA